MNMTCQLAQLCSLRPLTIPTTYWPVGPERLIAREPELEQVIRVTGSVGVRCWPEDLREAIFAAVDLCQRHGASLSVHYSPWHSVFGVDDRPTPFEATREIQRKEYRRMWGMFDKVWDLVYAANLIYRSNVKVRWVLLDTEVFVVAPDDADGAAEWNAAITKLNTMCYRVGKAIWPGAEVRWYDYGTTLGDYKRFTGNEPSDGYACSLYATANLDRTREHYEWAVGRVIGKISPWICLGAGYHWWGDERQPWDKTGVVPLQNSWQLGYEIGHPDECPPWQYVDMVVLWPDPWHSNYPNSGDHFIAYARGFNGDDLMGYTGWRCPAMTQTRKANDGHQAD